MNLPWYIWLAVSLWVVLGLKISYDKLKNDDILRHAETVREIARIEEQNKYADMRIQTLTEREPPWASLS